MAPNESRPDKQPKVAPRVEHKQSGWDDTPNVPKPDFISNARLVHTDKDLSVKDLYSMTDVEFENNKGVKNSARTVVNSTTDFTYKALLTDFYIAVHSGNGQYTIVLPPSKLAGKGKRYIIKDIDAFAKNFPIIIQATPLADEGVDVWNPYSISTPLGAVSIICTGESGWELDTEFSSTVQGFYVPNTTIVNNVAGASAYQCQYYGSLLGFITVTGMIDIQPNAPGPTEVWIDLPQLFTFSPAFNAPSELAGVGFCGDLAGEGFAIRSNFGLGGSDDSASFYFVATTTGSNNTYAFTFSYSPLNIIT